MLGVVGLSVGLQHILVLEPAEAVVVGGLRPGGCEFERGCWSLADAVFVTETGEDVTVEVKVPTDAQAGHKVDLYYNPNDPATVTNLTMIGGWGLVGMGIAAFSFGAFIALYEGNLAFRAAWKLFGMLLFVFTGFAFGLMIFFLLMGLDLPVIAIGVLFASILPPVVFPIALYPNIRVKRTMGSCRDAISGPASSIPLDRNERMAAVHACHHCILDEPRRLDRPVRAMHLGTHPPTTGNMFGLQGRICADMGGGLAPSEDDLVDQCLRDEGGNDDQRRYQVRQARSGVPASNGPHQDASGADEESGSDRVQQSPIRPDWEFVEPDREQGERHKTDRDHGECRNLGNETPPGAAGPHRHTGRD